MGLKSNQRQKTEKMWEIPKKDVFSLPFIHFIHKRHEYRTYVKACVAVYFCVLRLRTRNTIKIYIYTKISLMKWKFIRAASEQQPEQQQQWQKNGMSKRLMTTVDDTTSAKWMLDETFLTTEISKWLNATTQYFDYETHTHTHTERHSFIRCCCCCSSVRKFVAFVFCSPDSKRSAKAICYLMMKKKQKPQTKTKQ